LPAVKALESFDFSFQPSLKREQIESLHELNFIERRENVMLLGPAGRGQDPPGDQARHRRVTTAPPRQLRHPDRPDHVA
jgi:hypothetical protein